MTIIPEIKNNRSFTLIELVIVLSILAIIASAAVSTFVDVANKAYGVQEDATMRSLQSAALLYYAKNDRWWGVDENEPPFRLLENPPPFVVVPLNGVDPFLLQAIENVHWVLDYDVINNNKWQIWCPHSYELVRGKNWSFYFRGAGYDITFNIKH